MARNPPQRLFTAPSRPEAHRAERANPYGTRLLHFGTAGTILPRCQRCQNAHFHTKDALVQGSPSENWTSLWRPRLYPAADSLRPRVTLRGRARDQLKEARMTLLAVRNRL